MGFAKQPREKYNPKSILLGRCTSREGQAKCDSRAVDAVMKNTQKYLVILHSSFEIPLPGC